MGIMGIYIFKYFYICKFSCMYTLRLILILSILIVLFDYPKYFNCHYHDISQELIRFNEKKFLFLLGIS
jgi:hypothetical protein